MGFQNDSALLPTNRLALLTPHEIHPSAAAIQLLLIGRYKVIIGCEIVYEDVVIIPLWASIRGLLAHSKESVFVLGFYLRSKPMQEDMLSQAAAAGFVCAEVPRHEYASSEGFLRESFGLGDAEWKENFMDNWDAENFHIYLFRWSDTALPRADPCNDKNLY